MVKRAALVFGLVFAVVGICGLLVPGGMGMTADMATAPMLLGLFPVNLLHNIVHLLFGAWGLMASRSFSGAKSYCQIGGVVYIILAVLGFVAPTTFGLIPIGGNDIWLHAVLGIVLAGIGFTAQEAAAPK